MAANPLVGLFSVDGKQDLLESLLCRVPVIGKGYHL